jgi:hypothetical protein
MFNLKSVLGKVFVLAIVIFAAKHSLLAGIVALLLLIALDPVIEGMENKEDDSSKESDSSDESDKSDDKTLSAKDKAAMANFRKENCVDGKLMKDNTVVTPLSFQSNFPNVKFTSKPCHPCDETCDFEIVSSEEKLTVEENLRSIDSNSSPVDREKAITKSKSESE